MKLDVHKLSDKELTALQKTITKERGKRAANAKREAAKAVNAIAEKYGFSLGELMEVSAKPAAKKATKRKVAPSEAKYANPADAAQTWTGRGRRPKWFMDAMAKGTDPASMEV